MKNYATRPASLRCENSRWGAMSAAGHPGPKALPPPWLPKPWRATRSEERKFQDGRAEAIHERKWLRSLVQSFAKSGTTE